MTAFEFRPNWRDGVKSEYSFKTDVFTTRSGREQRRALREQPRLSIMFTTEPLVGGAAAAARRRLLTTMADDHVLPDYLRKVSVAGVLGPLLTLEQVPYWIEVGAPLAAIGGDGTIAAVTVTVVAGKTVTVTGLPAGMTPVAVRPRFTAALTSWQQDVETATVSESRVVFDVLPGTAIDARDDPLYTYDGREVFTWTPNWASVPQVELDQPRDEVDMGFGLTSHAKPQAWATRSAKSLAFIDRPCCDIGDVVSFFIRQRGRTREFFTPTWEADLTPTAGLIACDTLLRVADTDISGLLENHSVIRHIVVQLNCGRQLFRRIVSVTGSDIQVDRRWLWDEPLGSIRRISFVLLHRFASDQIAAEAVTTSVAQVRTGMLSLPYAASEYSLPAMSGIQIDYRETYTEMLDWPALADLNAALNGWIASGVAAL